MDEGLMRVLAVGVGSVLLATHSAPAQGTTNVPEYYNATWSPDSRAIAFESTRDGKTAIYIVRTDGTLRRLTSATVGDYQPRWSPDGETVVFVSTRDGHGEVYLMQADGSRQRRVTTSPADRSHYVPSFSRDGNVIMFAFHDRHRAGIYGVGVVRPDGSQMRVLTDSTRSSEEPAWSPDREWIVFQQFAQLERKPGEAPRAFGDRRNATRTFMAIRPDGSGRHEATASDVPHPVGEHEQGVPSPNGRWSVRAKSGVDGGIFLRDVQTGTERRLVGR
jgi:dipeptidyl aminopeptidase/acylaminoacyl peptidase